MKTNMGGKPVNFVNWYDAVRFANWLHNGQGKRRHRNRRLHASRRKHHAEQWDKYHTQPRRLWFLPSENEWYKAAYYDPRTAAQGGPPGNDNYWLYPTASDSQPIRLPQTAWGRQQSGCECRQLRCGADWNGQDGNVTTVGSAGPSSASYYGTSDQGGNVWEWNDSAPGSIFRRIRGGSWQDGQQSLSVLNPQGFTAATAGTSDLGFRVATIVPEPATSVLVIIGGIFSLGSSRKFGTNELRAPIRRAAPE